MRHHSIGFKLGCQAVALGAAMLLAMAMPSSAAELPAAKLDRSSVPAKGKQSALLTVGAFGRYAVTVTSDQGVALQMVDRMSGAGPVVGQPGREDGRLDLFFDRGEQKIVTIASPHGKGRATLTAHGFRELQEHPPLLVEHRLEQASLGDFEQRSYWLEITNKRVVALEAAGRYLADLRLWRDGTWLVDAVPRIVQSQARPEQPLTVARLTAELEPGLYLLTAYGGPSQRWTQASDAKPFLLRFGIPSLPTAMRQQFTMSDFGVERYLVPAGPNFFRLELPTAEGATLSVGDYSPADPFDAQGSGASIDKRSVPPVVELHQGGNGVRLVTVTMQAGKSFVLQHFAADYAYHFDGSGDYWLSSIHAGSAEDSVGANAVLTRQFRWDKEEYVTEQAIELSRDAPWHRRFNLLDNLTLFVKVPAATKVRILGKGVAARYRFEPFLTSRPANYQTPPWRDGNFVFELDRGLYVLSVTPETKGILDLQLLPDGSKPHPELSPVLAAARFPALHLDRDWTYTLYLNRQPGVTSGAVLRPLPVDLASALPVTQRAGETLTIPVTVPEKGTLRAMAEDGRLLGISLDNGRKGTALEVEPGRYQVTVAAKDAPQSYSLGVEPSRLASKTPLPALPDARLAGLPKFPVITAEAPSFLDLKRHSTKNFSVRVDKPGLYQFESSGLLQTAGKVRTRTVTSLFEEAENGVGRNFQIQRYLREGDYQLGVSTRGQTQGDLGVRLTRTEVMDGGELRESQVARALLPSGRALAYRMRVARRGSYHLQTLGLGRTFDVRIEDSGGWPVLAPIEHGDLNLSLERGSYRVLILPQAAEARVVTHLERLAEAKRYKGHGPHRIALDSTVEHTWLETAKGAARQPDQWEFVLPAAAQITIALDNEMEGTLVKADATEATLASIDARQPWRGDLTAGRYLLRARNSRSNNYVAYTLRVTATQLLAGQSRVVAAPASVPVSVGADGLVELESFGSQDVRARLLNVAGEVVAQDDDRPNDWNFQIAERLPPGQYRLLVEPVSEKRAQTTVAMRVRSEVGEKPLALGSDVAIKDARVHVYPLALPANGNVILVTGRASEAMGLALEGESAQGWITLGKDIGKQPHLALPLGAERLKAYRLRSWSADQRSLDLVLRAAVATLPPTTESRWLQGGIAPLAVDEKRPGLKAALITLSRPGTFRVKGDIGGLQWTDSGSRTAQASGSPVVSISGNSVLLLAEDGSSAAAATLAAERLQLPTGDDEALRIELMAGQVASADLQPHRAGPSLVLAQARAGQPGVSLNAAHDAAAMGVVAGEAVAVALPGAAAPARVWNAAGAAAPLELDLRQVPLQQLPDQTTGFGVSDGAIRAHGALPIRLPAGTQQVRLAVSPRNAAVFMKQGSIQSIHWAGEEPLQEAATVDADRLWVLNGSADEARYSLEVAPNGQETPVLKPGGLFERNLSAAGRLRVAVELPKDATGDYRLRVHGDAQAVWEEDGGRIDSGNDIVVRRSGVLWLQHQPGTLVAWLDEPPAQGMERIVNWFKAIQETAVKPPQVVSLKGKQQVLAFKLDQPAMLHVRTSAPVVSQYVAAGRPAQTAAHLFGANINLLAPAGSSKLLLRAVGADSLSGTSTAVATPAIPLADGLGPEVLLSPGSARLYVFVVRQASTIGIGIRASSDVVRSALYDEQGTLQSEGVVQMPSLAPGRYYLTVEMPADSAPVRVQPIIVGLKEPDIRPPLDILRRYVEAKEGGEALLYVPPPPPPPPGAATVENEEAPAEEGDAGEVEPSDPSGQTQEEEQ